MSLHINAEPGEVAEHVLLPGDPYRARWIAETFLEDVKCYNEVRGMYGFTGFYNGKRVSVPGTGMGIPSLAIYVYELIHSFHAETLIRVGSAGALQQHIQIRDIVMAVGASTDSSFNHHIFGSADFAATANFELLLKAAQVADQRGIQIKAGNILTSDVFYHESEASYAKWTDYGVLCVEMETAGLYSLAARYGVNALSLLTISDSIVTGEQTSSEERETTFKEMIYIALETL